MTRYFLYGTLLWEALSSEVAGEDIAGSPAVLTGWSVERAAAGDWPILVPGGTARGAVTRDLGPEACARLDWYESAYAMDPRPVSVDTPDGPVTAVVYHAAEGTGGAGVPWSATDWIATHGPRTRIAAAEIMRGRGRTSAEEIAARCPMIHARAQGIATARGMARRTTVGQEMQAGAVEVARVGYPYEGFPRVEEWTLDHPRFDGTRSGPMQRAVAQFADAATVLPYDPRRDRVLVVEQFRVGAMAKGDARPWLLEPIAGVIDGGETAERTAIREAREEAGIRIVPGDLHLVGRYYPSPGGLAQTLQSYVALCDLPDGVAGLHGLAAEGEDIRGHLVGFDALMAMVTSGEAANAPLIISAQWLALHRDRLRG